MDLARLIIEHRDLINSVDPAEVADSLYNALSSDEKRQALAIVLPGYVRLVLNDPPDRLTIVAPSPTLGPSVDSAPQTSKSENRLPTPGPSKKLANGILWRRTFAPSIGSRRLGDLTRSDVKAVIAYKSKKSAEVACQAARYEKLLALMEEQGATRVENLPVTAVQYILDGEK